MPISISESSNKDMNSKPRVAVVTGANRGIGFEVCRQLAGRGIHVILTCRDEGKGTAACQKLKGHGLDVRYRHLDVTDPTSIHRLETFIQEEYGRLDILINNAGVGLEDQASVFKMRLDILDATLRTNFYGPLLLCQAFVPLMKRNKYGRIVNVSSGLGQLDSLGNGYPAYELSKAALNALTLSMARELRGTNVLENAMCPGWVRTDMGGWHAPRSVEEGADTVVWLATLPDGGPQGGFFRDRQPIPW
jgi:NAD(P)-dependent dehydrogenase (short-subunit alcohol dehydrogenase family)